MMGGIFSHLTVWLRARAEEPMGAWIFLLGALMTLGYAPFGLWPVAILSLAGLWWLVRHATSTRQALGAALVWGLGHQLTALYWLPWAFFKDAGGSWLAAIGGGVPAVIGLSLFGSLAFMATAFLAYRAGKRYGWRAGASVFVVAWVGFEFVKGLHPMGFPWLPVGATWATSTALMQAAAVGGVWLLSLIILTISVLLCGNSDRKRAAILLLAVVYVAGAVRVARTPMDESGDVVRVVQPNIQSAHKWDAQLRWAFLQETMGVALDGRRGPIPPTVIMPETAVAFYLDEEDDVRNALTGQLSMKLPSNGGLVTGTVRRELATAEHPDRYYNSLAVMDTRGTLRSMYDKRLLVPFGEYIPGRTMLEQLPLPVTLRTFSQSRIDFTHGEQSPLMPTPAGFAVGLICYEGIFPAQVAVAAAEARYLVNITNDSWFTGTIALYQHAALTRLRAVETGLPVVRVANTGITVVYDGVGREIVKLPTNVAAYADVELPAPLAETYFVKFFDQFRSLFKINS